MRINYNVSAHISINALNSNDNKLSKSLEKLSSGLQIVGAKNNPAGLAMSKRMNMQIEGLSVASQNASDGQSITETADGTLAEIQDMLQRMNELAVKANNGTLTDDDRKTINDEITQLKDEITRISKETEFNGQPLLDGTWDLKGYSDTADIKVSGYSDSVSSGDYTIPTMDITWGADGAIESVTAYTDGNKTAECIDAEGNQDLSMATPGTDCKALPAGSQVTNIDGNRITISDGAGFSIQLDVTAGTTTVGSTNSNGDPVNATLELKNLGAMTLQIGANENQTLEMRIPEISLKNLGIENIDVSTLEGSNDALSRMGDAIQYISDVRSRLGAYQNRLEHTVDSLDVTSENMTAAYSRIMDVDMAEEMTTYTTQQVMSQAATSMLAQANQRPSDVLQLLQ
ncbi:MAG: flagellin [Lachnospiraceae bacterium]|nr:flagellin [Lachnospiraceae bacterium]